MTGYHGCTRGATGGVPCGEALGSTVSAVMKRRVSSSCIRLAVSRLVASPTAWATAGPEICEGTRSASREGEGREEGVEAQLSALSLLSGRKVGNCDLTAS